ncbi:MAG: substrate-binding domain-containing protein [Opitutaceae bacterium]|jgi:phosphate transport system substrate-binding protein
MRLVTLFFLAITLPLSLVRAEVRVVGCDLLGKDFIDGLTAYARRNDLDIKLDLKGSESGLEQLRMGTADLGIILLAPETKKPEEPLMSVTAAYQTLVVVIPASVPLAQISFDQLNALYADDADSSVKRWGDLGVTGGWTNRGILPAITGPGGGLSYDLFRYTVMRTPALKPMVSTQASVEATLQRVLGDEGGIAIIPLLPDKQRGLKVLAVARKTNDVAFGPTAENIQSGDYPIRLPVYFVFKKTSAKKLQLVLRYLLSEEAVPLWKGARLMPLPIQTRNQQIFDLEVL